MASGKETSRQKMINLMYLVFIAMLALNMSKEVLSAFGMITEQTQDNTALLESRVDSFKTAIDLAVTEKQEGFNTDFKTTADSIQIISDNFDNYISSILPNEVKKTIQNQVSGLDTIINDYEVMDKADYFNNLWFLNSDGKLTDASTLNKDELPLGDTSGEGFIRKMNEFKTQFSNLIIKFSPESDPNYVQVNTGDSINDEEPGQFTAGFKTGKGGTYSDIIDGVNNIFSTNDVVNREGQGTSWMEYHFYGFPEVASTTKLALLQSNIRSAQAELYSAMLGGQFKLNSTLSNFDAYVVADRSSYYSGSNFTGKIVLGKKSDDLDPKSALINNIELLENDNPINSDGSINLDFRAGKLGMNEITGNVVFMEDGKEIAIPVNALYEVVNKPNAATVSADKMNVVYKGVRNPFTISIPGVDANNINPMSTPGIKRGKLDKDGNQSNKPGDYEIDLRKMNQLPQLKNTTPKNTLNVTVIGTLPDGERVTSVIPFRMKNLPAPNGTIFKQKGSFSMPKQELIESFIQAEFSDEFDFKLPLTVLSFMINVPGKGVFGPIIGDEFTKPVRSALNGVPAGTQITISDIETKGIGVSTLIPLAAPIIITLQ